MKLSELASELGSSVAATDKEIEVNGISTLQDAGADEVAFLTDRKYLSQLDHTKAGAVLISEKIAPVDMPHIPLKEVWPAVIQTLKIFHPGFARKTYQGVHPAAVVDPSARLADNVAVGPMAVIGPETSIGSGSYIGAGVVIGAGCNIGENCTIYANAVLEAGTKLANDVYIQAGAVIGADGFKYELISGRWTKVPQVGHVSLGAGSEIGANACIDRASYTVTSIGDNTKIDNLVQIGHNVKIGQNTIIVALSGIAGSTTIGNNTIFAAQSGAADNLNIGSQVVIFARSGVTSDVADGDRRLGMPARPFAEEARVVATTKKLPQMAAELTRLAKKVAELEERLKKTEK